MLFTHTVFMDKFPGGRQRLDHSVHGGELFQTILFNQVLTCLISVVTLLSVSLSVCLSVSVGMLCSGHM